jgi:hypothetical protein
MQAAIERDRIAKARGHKDPEAPIIEPAAGGKGKGPDVPALPRSDSKAAFRLYKNTNATNRAEYLGHVTTPEGRVYHLEACVVEYDRADGTKGKFFEGKVFGGHDLVKKMLKGAKVEGQLPEDMLKVLEELPFDDSEQLTTNPTGEST